MSKLTGIAENALKEGAEKLAEATNGKLAEKAAGLAEGAAGKAIEGAEKIAEGTGKLAGGAVKTASGAAASLAATRLYDADEAAALPKTRGWGFWPWFLISLPLIAFLGFFLWKTASLSGISAIKWIFGGLLGIGALLSLFGLLQMFRRHPYGDEKRGSPRGLGFMTMLSGLAVLIGSWFVWQPKLALMGEAQDKLASYGTTLAALKADKQKLSGDLSSLMAENKRLKGQLASNSANADEIARLKGVVAGLSKDNDAKAAEIARLKGLLGKASANGDEIARLKGVVANLSKDNDTKAAEITRLNGLLNNSNASGAEIGRLKQVIAKLSKDNDAKAAEISSLKEKIDALTNDGKMKDAEISSLKASLLKARQRPQTAAAPESPLSLMHSARLNPTALRLQSKNYDIVEDKNDEIIKGKKGHYYQIKLKNPANGKNYRFASGSYFLVQPRAAFKKSLDEAIANIKDGLDGRRNYQIYVRGKASAGRYNGKLDKNHPYSDIKVLAPYTGNGPSIYEDRLVDRHYGPAIHNADLPNLRAAFLQDYISRNYDVGKPIIVDGKVSKSKQTAKQAVSIMLYVED